jgi:signal transduction histidine kinase
VQESLTNASKYAEAKQVDISVRDYSNHVQIEIRDDGRGFDVRSTKPLTHGLAGMRHRVEASGGRLMVVSAPGNGTRITATLPKVTAPAPAPAAATV